MGPHLRPFFSPQKKRSFFWHFIDALSVAHLLINGINEIEQYGNGCSSSSCHFISWDYLSCKCSYFSYFVSAWTGKKCHTQHLFRLSNFITSSSSDFYNNRDKYVFGCQRCAFVILIIWKPCSLNHTRKIDLLVLPI